ncbi:hypothetical protein EDB80DRAFT_747443 [Ilyonectria destructans]|nr:hypothetical protein EDB80DRAFT_747443 [Ilyonectria destructans]
MKAIGDSDALFINHEIPKPRAAEGQALGDEVIGLAYGGAYAEYIAVTGAGTPETWITATQALHQVLNFVKGKSILWHAGASGVSIAGIQLSHLAGAAGIFATAGWEEKCDCITKELGATVAFNYKTQTWMGEIMRNTENKWVDYIIGLPRDGRIVILGTLGGDKVPEADISQILYKRLRIEGSTLRSRDEEYQTRRRNKLEEYLPSFKSGRLKIYIDKVYPWKEIQEAHKHIEESKNVGKVICTVS